LITILLVLLIMVASSYAFIFVSDFLKNRQTLSKKRWSSLIGIGLLTDFLDTLGIGSFAITASIYKLGGFVDDLLLPGTMNAGHCLPTVAEALIFMTVIKVDALTLTSMIISSATGAVFGARIVSKLNLKAIRMGMGIALIAVAFLILAKLMNWLPAGNTATGLTGIKLVIAVVANFFLGAFMTIGVGQYAPCMALVFALGMSPQVAFPIMMGSCAFLMPAASIQFVKSKAIDRKAAMGLTIGGIVGVLIAAYLVKSLPIRELTWVVLIVLVYTAFTMIRSAIKTTPVAKDPELVMN